MKFILSRNEDYKSHSKKWIVGYGFLFWLISRIVAMIIMGVCLFVYDKYGINPRELTNFGGDPTVTLSSRGLLRAVLMTALIAPVFEELLFRFGLSFRKVSVGISLACVALFYAFSHNKTATLIVWIISCSIAIAIFCCIYFATKNEFWQQKKIIWQIPAIWISSIAFGLVHLLAFSSLSWILLPYALATCLIPFFAGCSCAYLRVNIGFGWGLVKAEYFNDLYLGALNNLFISSIILLSILYHRVDVINHYRRIFTPKHILFPVFQFDEDTTTPTTVVAKI